MAATYNILCLDIGKSRIGVAIADSSVKLPRPLKTIYNQTDVLDRIEQLILENDVKVLVLGLPRSLDAQETNQTKYVRDFQKKLSRRISLPIHLEDEALSSVRAKEDLEKSKKPFSKEDIDALAACFILEDFISNNVELVNA
ncbi:MAG TPA: Holliday junction resolvase RuvX [Candidatus Saccharimonadia bacterium]|nr:Holliday junction resolvase RuvX [Candidatus Saccharimonadia bacterium]